MTERIFRCQGEGTLRSAFVMAWNAAKALGFPFEVVLRPLKVKRSGEQNKRYWALIREVAGTVWVSMPMNPGDRHSEWGQRQCDPEVWHMFFRKAFIGTDSARMPDGDSIEVPISTTTLTVDEMTTYMRDIEQWCVEQGFPLGGAA